MSTVEEIKYEGMKEKLTEEITQEVTRQVTEQVTRQVTEQVMKEGLRIFIQGSLEDDIPEERTLVKLQRYYNISKEKAERYYREFTAEN